MNIKPAAYSEKSHTEKPTKNTPGPEKESSEVNVGFS